MKHSISTGTR